MRKRSASRFCPRTRLFTDPFSRLQLFLYVQASAFASLPGRSYRGKFPCRAAEAFTSELNVHRCLCTHRIYYPPDNRQLAERGLTPRKIHSIVDCSSHFWGALQGIAVQQLCSKACSKQFAPAYAYVVSESEAWEVGFRPKLSLGRRAAVPAFKPSVCDESLELLLRHG